MDFAAGGRVQDESINELSFLLSALNVSLIKTNHIENQSGHSSASKICLDAKEFEQNIARSRKVFGLMMRAFFRKNDDNKFQPCQDELDFLKGMVEAVHLCYDLRHRASLRQFYHILLPGKWDSHTGDFNTGIEHLNMTDSIFHIDQNIGIDRKEFKDLRKRAKRIASEIKQNPDSIGERNELDVHILDGHGRMLVLLMKELDVSGIDLDTVKFKVFEIDEVVHEYHKYVFNKRIEKVKGCVINQSPLPQKAFIYLNFCSIMSATEFDWTTHFKEQDIRDYKCACVKENVLRFIAKATGHPYNCTIMISFVIKHNHGPFVYQVEFKKTLGDHLTGLGFLYVLLNDFNADIVSVRPDYEIEWYDPRTKRIPKKLYSGGKGCPFVSLLVKPGDYRENLEQRFAKGCPPPSDFIEDDEVIILDSTDRKIADLKEDTIQKDVRVEITSGTNKGRQGTVISRTAAKARVELNGNSIINPNLNQMKVL